MMRSKTILLTGLLAIIAVAVGLIDAFYSKADKRIGMPIIDMKQMIGVNSISYIRGETKVELVMDSENQWRMGSISGFPADAGKVSRLVDDVTRGTVQILVAEARNQNDDFGFKIGGEIILKRGGQVVSTVMLGARRPQGGQFLAFNGDNKVYLTDHDLERAATEDYWELKRLINVPAEEIKSVAFKPAPSSSKKPVVLTRDKSGETIKVASVSENIQDVGRVTSQAGLLRNLEYTKRTTTGVPEFAAAMRNPDEAMVTLFDGRKYSVKVGQTSGENQKYFLSVKATPPTGTTAVTADAKLDEWINQVMGQYCFEVSKETASRFQLGLADVTTKKSSKAAKI